MTLFAGGVYLLSLITSLVCMMLLLRGYRRSGTFLLLCSGLCFVFLSLNNLLLFVGATVFPDIDLRLPRAAASLAGVTLLLCGFIWEPD